jgi:hypothetical protein
MKTAVIQTAPAEVTLLRNVAAERKAETRPQSGGELALFDRRRRMHFVGSFPKSRMNQRAWTLAHRRAH